MIDKRALYTVIDELSADDLEELYQHIKRRRQVVSFHTATGTHPAVSDTPPHESAETIRDEVNALIDETIAEVRRKRETQEIAKVESNG